VWLQTCLHNYKIRQHNNTTYKTLCTQLTDKSTQKQTSTLGYRNNYRTLCCKKQLITLNESLLLRIRKQHLARQAAITNQWKYLQICDIINPSILRHHWLGILLSYPVLQRFATDWPTFTFFPASVQSSRPTANIQQVAKVIWQRLHRMTPHTRHTLLVPPPIQARDRQTDTANIGKNSQHLVHSIAA